MYNKNRCNGDGIYLNKFLIDNGNSRLTPISSVRIDSLLDGKLFRLHSRLEMAAVTKNEIKIINLNTDSLKSAPLPSSDKRGAIVSLIDYSSNGLALMSLNQEGLFIELFEQQATGLKLVGDYQTDIGRITLNREVLNYSEALAFVQEELSSMAANMIIASIYEPYSKTLKFNLSFRRTGIEAIAVDIDPKTKKFLFMYSFTKTTGSRSKFFVNMNLDTLAFAQSQISSILRCKKSWSRKN